MIDITAEMFKGELGAIYEIENNYTLKQIADYRAVRMERLAEQQKMQEEQQKEMERKQRMPR